MFDIVKEQVLNKTNNIGKRTHRLQSESLEKSFADKWNETNRNDSILGYLLSDTVNEKTCIEPHDREVAATLIQWLGSNCGLSLLRSVLKLDELDGWDKHLRNLRK